ncbi:IspD/TarI family cytidylyltransferase [Pseudonocardia zijingensis]|uniref:2-C-methyl-D-erythritol 4-phosphate cytidylyltransferase n=1 Tax=Pseudonocardia zijingensis TaxID=153376 RepID=A0ABP3ZZZ8_9PSEU
MRVVAVVVAGSERALTPVGRVPMVVRAVQALAACTQVELVTVATVDELRPQVEAACAGAPVDMRALSGTRAHTLQRRGATGSDDLVTAGGGDVVLLHDACRPMAPGELATAVVEAVRDGHGMAVPVLPLTDTVKSVDEHGVVTGTPDRAGLRVLQTPIAVQAGLWGGEDCADPLALVRRRTAEGHRVHAVPGHPAAFAVRSAWDLEVAELIAGGRIRL